MEDGNIRLRIAARIHFALLRHLGDTVPISEIVHRPEVTREVLWVCEGSDDEELMQLARLFRHVMSDGFSGEAELPTVTDTIDERDLGHRNARIPTVAARTTNGRKSPRAPVAAGPSTIGWRRPIDWLRGKPAAR